MRMGFASDDRREYCEERTTQKSGYSTAIYMFFSSRSGSRIHTKYKNMKKEEKNLIM